MKNNAPFCLLFFLILSGISSMQVLSAQQKSVSLQQSQQGQIPQATQMYQQWIFQNLYKQELQKYQKHEEKLLHQQEQEIEQEKARLEAELRMIDAEYESTAQAEKQSVNFWKPEYTA